MPHMCGPVTAIAAFAATAASTALPPWAMAHIPACDASWSAVATIASRARVEWNGTERAGITGDSRRTGSGVPDIALDQYVLEHGRAVGHDPVDPEVEQAVHLRRVVDRPHVDLHVSAVRPAKEPLRHHDRPS